MPNCSLKPRAILLRILFFFPFPRPPPGRPPQEELSPMKEIRIHARAGQGAITTASILGYAYFLEGIFAYAFPHFGAARMGAPMNAFVRVDDKPVRLRSQIYEP